MPTFGSTKIITYTYDPLSRLTNAFYSSGACFRYNYDALGNVTWSEETVTSTRVITYAYDMTSRLRTSKVDIETTTWYYNYDANGNLVEMTPNGGMPANGAIRYTYNGANQLNKIESHNGSAYVTLAQMAYDGLGSRVVLTGWVGGVAYTTTYASRIAGKVQILQATSGANTTSYLYGLNQIGEFGLQSVYYLVDGAGSIRHLVDPNGAVKLARMYEPFGQVLMQKGTGELIYGYLGAQFDRISGLLYINGRYYDPVTGRFLTPNDKGQNNPYAPLGGAALAPILILALIDRRRKGKIWTGWIVLAMMMSVGMLVAACGAGENSSPPSLLPSSGAEPMYDPSSWNTAPFQESNNCYSYAVNDRNIHTDTTGGSCKPQPGVAGGKPLQGKFTYPKVSNAVLADGLLATNCDKACPAGTYKVMLFVDTTGVTDYHFYRQDASGYWSSKPGSKAVTNLDTQGQPITDPRNAQRDYGSAGRDPNTGYIDSLIYDAPCGCFCVPVGIQTQCLR